MIEDLVTGDDLQVSSERCPRLLQRPMMREYVTLTAPTDGAAAAGGG
jgi:hypothetical protein